MNKMLKIGSVELAANIVLAPMAGVTDITYRTICKEMGAGLVCTEMVSAKGLYYKDVKTKRLMKINEKNRPVSLQIFGSDPDIMAYVVNDYINNRKDIDIIDINMGCPTPKIVKNGDGSALMRSPKLAGEIVNKIKKISVKPVTVKIRSGWDSNNINAPEFAKVLEYNGADMIAVHGRTREQFYTGRADYNVIKKVKESVNIPIVGNGDIYSPQDAVKMSEATSCDGVMVARGILGNPWLIMNIAKIFSGNDDFFEPTVKDKIQMIKRHALMLVDELDEKIAILEMRKFAAWYMKGMKNSSETRNKINKITTADDMLGVLNEYIKAIEVF
ncbi:MULTISPECIES: tRNA dihydrouridine synthase DusB [unclassified Sedimentibacter]|uniref:tRNA dihydrouridine synthase DusB n=1 Tax=unclassified Sedimentibacter TaxID=2649220 RepID=UPI0027E1DA68|nr:tRNA dihydrouridine synthase DusB [Sedimentibacter sp. MB35-C1]WMJ78195.1 tRNA dihydrouridine synthase DusB [Sedimentibacter sp. MB35-C1]